MFDFTRHMRALCEDIIRRTPALAHIDLDRVAIAFTQTRGGSAHGLQARLTPLRFQGGAPFTVRGGRRWRLQSLVLDGREMLYILTFFLPRFLNRPPRDKLLTIFHELYHISERCDGDVRRLPGRHYAHTRSRQQYDRLMDHLVERYLNGQPDPQPRAFLQLDFLELCRRYGGLCGLRVPIPKLLPVDGSGPAQAASCPPNVSPADGGRSSALT